MLCLATVCLTGGGCLWGPRTLQNSQTHYNRAVQTTAREEMLLNLVRMKYRDSIEFVKIPSITGQHTYSGGVGLSFPFSGAPGSGSTALAAESKPTIVYQPEQAQEFNQRLLSRIGLETLDLLTSKGWAADRVLPLVVRSINDVDNATSAGGPTPQEKPVFEQFQHLAKLLRELQKRRQIELAYESLTIDKPKQVADPIEAKYVDGEAVLAAAEKGYRFRRGPDGRLTLWTHPKAVDSLVLRVAPDAKSSPEMQQIVEALELQPGRDYYRVVLDKFGQLQRPAAWRFGHSIPLPRREEINMSTRSIKEIMFYLSHGTVVPQSHVDQGLITRTVDESGREFDWRCMTGDLLQIQFSHLPPRHAAVSVHYRGHWFYIDDRDQSSKSTFNLLIELFNLKIRAGGGSQIPLITI
jgi:hypothetical protein